MQGLKARVKLDHHFQLILGELIRNMALTFAVITVITFLLLANVRMTLIVVLCIAFTILNVTGYFLNLAIHYYCLAMDY